MTSLATLVCLIFVGARCLGSSYASDVTYLRDRRNTAVTYCCMCDDADSDKDKRCSTPQVCDNNFQRCDYCETSKRHDGATWRTVRRCGTRDSCVAGWYHAYSTPACAAGFTGSVSPGTSCNTCCKNVVAGGYPFVCVKDADAHIIHFNLTTLPTTSTTTTTTTTTPTTTTKPTTTTTTPTTTTTTPKTTTTTQTTTTTTPTPTATTPTTTTTTPTTTTTTPTTTTTTPQPGGVCEICSSGTDSRCFSALTRTCDSGQKYCMNTIVTQADGTNTIQKSCATDTECYYDSWLGMKQNPDCLQAVQSGNITRKGACHFCCQTKYGVTSPCNVTPIPSPSQLVTYGNLGIGSKCMTGSNGIYMEQMCDKSRPLCMNTVVLDKTGVAIKKECAAEVACEVDWWNSTRHRAECMAGDLYSSTSSVDEHGLVCHYCCKPGGDKACNVNDIPSEVYQFQTKNNTVNGGWTSWGSWNLCSASCDGGIRIRIRQCSNPYPSNGGARCSGHGFQEETCNTAACAGAVVIG